MIWLAAGALFSFVTVAGLMVVAFVVLLDRLDAAHRRFAVERHDWVVERRELNQRIQAPEIATVQAIEVPDRPSYVSPDDDEGFWAEYHARVGVTDG